MQPLECCSPLVLSYPKSFLSAAEPPLGRAEEGRRCLALRRFLPEGGRDEGWWFVEFSLQREKPTQRVFGSREKRESFCWNRFETLEALLETLSRLQIPMGVSKNRGP